MARPLRKVLEGGYYHVLNRGNGRMTIFRKDGDYEAFARILAEGVQKYAVELLCWCLMGNHWHLVVRPMKAAALGQFMQWVGVTHVRRHHANHKTQGGGHLYQGRFKSFLIQEDGHFLTVCRYVEANPLRAKLVKRAEGWRWSSLGYQGAMRKGGEQGVELKRAEWPVKRPGNWVEKVNEVMPKMEVEAVRRSVVRQSPYGEPKWAQRMARRLGLESTMRAIGRPRKSVGKNAREKNGR